LRGKVIGSEEEVDVYQGMKELLQGMDDVDAIGILSSYL
jgi:hypothetical protein